MVKYIYERYNSVKKYRIDYIPTENIYMPFGSTMFQNVTQNPTTGAISLGSPTKSVYDGGWLNQYWYANASGGQISRLETSGSTGMAGGYTSPATRVVPGEYHERGALVNSNVVAEDGTYPVNGNHADGYWYIRGTIYNTAPTTPGVFTQPTGTLEIGDPKVISWGASSDAEGNLSKYVLEAAIGPAGWVVIAQPTTPTFTFTVPSTTAVTFRVKAVDAAGLESAYSQSATFPVNAKPTLILNTTNNRTLYENDTFLIDGTAKDVDVGNILNVYYRLNGGTSRAIATGISTGASIPFNEQLTFKAGKLHKDGVAITDALAEGPAHRLEVWSEDNQGGKSPIAERTFYVVPNRAPALTVDAFNDQSELINNDTIKLSGISSDPDGNDVTVKYRVNEQAAVQIHSGVAGPWSFDIFMKSLKDGENIIVVEVTDTYNFKSSRTIKLNKTENLTPLEHSVQRYKIVPPSGSAQGVLLWIQRDADQEVTAEISMTIGTEQERFVPLLKNDEDTNPNPQPAPISPGIVEDYFKYRADTPAEHIALKLSWTGDKPITFISGALLQ